MSEPKKTLKRRNALGKGLGALLADSNRNDENTGSKEGTNPGSVTEIPLAEVEVNPYQPRMDFDEDALQELAESIRVQGIIQPITVRKLGDKQYQLISGERRLQASKKAGLERIPAYVRTANDQQMLEMALIENIQRENLNPMEIAHSYQRLIAECNLKQEELGGRVGKKRVTVTHYLSLLRLPDQLQAALRDQKITMGHAKALLNIENIDTQLSLLEQIVEKEISVRGIEEMVKKLKAPAKPSKNEEGKDPENAYELNRLQEKLSSHFGTRVKINSVGKEKGEIKIPYQSTSDLNRILEILQFI